MSKSCSESSSTLQLCVCEKRKLCLGHMYAFATRLCNMNIGLGSFSLLGGGGAKPARPTSILVGCKMYIPACIHMYACACC